MSQNIQFTEGVQKRGQMCVLSGHSKSFKASQSQGPDILTTKSKWACLRIDTRSFLSSPCPCLSGRTNVHCSSRPCHTPINRAGRNSNTILQIPNISTEHPVHTVVREAQYSASFRLQNRPFCLCEVTHRFCCMYIGGLLDSGQNPNVRSLPGEMLRQNAEPSLLLNDTYINKYIQLHTQCMCVQ